VRLLLDMHVLIWWATLDPHLSADARAIVASSEHDVVVSAASFWEVAVKRARGLIRIDVEELAEASPKIVVSSPVTKRFPRTAASPTSTRCRCNGKLPQWTSST